MKLILVVLFAGLLLGQTGDAMQARKKEDWKRRFFSAVNFNNYITLEILLDEDYADVNAVLVQESDGQRKLYWTALHQAAKDNKPISLEVLLDDSRLTDETINAKLQGMWTAPMIAAEMGHVDCLQLCLNHPRVCPFITFDVIDDLFRYAETNEQAVRNGKTKALLCRTFCDGSNPLCLLHDLEIPASAQAAGAHKAVPIAHQEPPADSHEEVLRDQWDPEQFPFDHSTDALYELVRVDPMKYAADDNAEAMRLFFDKGGDPNAKYFDNEKDVEWTILQKASQQGADRVLQVVLDHPALRDETIKAHFNFGNSAWTAHLMAAEYGHIACLRVFFNHDRTKWITQSVDEMEALRSMAEVNGKTACLDFIWASMPSKPN